MDNIWTTMERRCSRRSFTAQPIAETQVKVLEEKIAGYNAETGLHMRYGEEKQGFKENMMKNMLARGAKAIDALMEVTGEQPEWFSEGMRAVMMAPTARNSRPFVFSCHNAVVSVRANGPAERVMVDIGIVKLHFELGAGGGKWSWGDKQTFQKT